MKHFFPLVLEDYSLVKKITRKNNFAGAGIVLLNTCLFGLGVCAYIFDHLFGNFKGLHHYLYFPKRLL